RIERRRTIPATSPVPVRSAHGWIHVAEFLRPFTGVDFGGVDVALRIHREIVHPMKLAGIAAVATERADDLAGFAAQGAYLVVGAVGSEQERLLGIDPGVEVRHRAGKQRILFDNELSDETAVFAKHLNAVVGAVANINEAVPGNFHAVHGIAKLR